VKLNPGSRLFSTSSTTEVVVVRAPTEDVSLSCCGAPMSDLEDGEAGATPSEVAEEAILIGKRYNDEATGMELLCTKGGSGPLECDGRLLVVKSSKPMPSSD
jgi:hypothetical protein